MDTPFSALDHRWMARALQLARRGLFTTTPNPRVGCVIAHGDRMIGEGWHERAGGPHAEIVALNMAGSRARGACVYVTLEPCAHQGKTPPCVEPLGKASVSCVIAAMTDPNPLVAGGGLAQLKAQGIEVKSGLLGGEAHELNVGFVSRMTRGRPWVRLKIAASLDGKTALDNGTSQWITGPEARRDAHRWRACSCAVLTGIGTILKDDPRLTVREIETPRQPIRVVVDSRFETPLSARVLEGGNAILAVARDDPEKTVEMEARGIRVVTLPDAHGKVDLGALMQELGRLGINEILVEAGFKLNGSLLRAHLVDELLAYLAPHLLGESAHGMFSLPELTTLAHRHSLKIHDVRLVGKDMRILARPEGS